MKIISTKKIVFAVVTAVVIVALIPFIQSCSNNEDSVQIESSKNTSLEYLDVDVSKMQEPTENQMEILKKAKDRINLYVVCENKKFILKVKSGSEIQMSERLFESFQAVINHMNLIIKDNAVVSDEKNPILFHISKSTLNSKVRFKASPNEKTPPGGKNDIELTSTGDKIYMSHQTLSYLTSGMGVAAFIDSLGGPISKYVGGGVATSSAAFYNYWASESPNGIVIEEVITWDLYHGFSYHMTVTKQ